MTPEADRADPFLDGVREAGGNAGAPELRLGTYEGLLDLLLELAGAQIRGADAPDRPLRATPERDRLCVAALGRWAGMPWVPWGATAFRWPA